MTKKSLILGAAALTLAGSALAPKILAYQGNPNVQGPNYTVERHEAMEKAFETNNYYAWKALMVGNGGRVTEVVNEQNFAQFARAHELAERGDLTGSQAIRASLGLGQQNGTGSHRGQGRSR